MNTPIKIRKLLKKREAYGAKYPFYFLPISKQGDTHIEIADKKLLNFCTFSYLSLGSRPEVINAQKNALDNWGAGNHGTRMLGGNLNIYSELETKLAEFTGKEKALLFNSGYMANMAVIQSIMTGRHDVVYSANKNHASINDGLELVRNSQIKHFDYDDLDDLEERISKENPDVLKLIVADSIFSMDANIIDLPKLLEIRSKVPNVLIMLDEAHSIGVLGQNGQGIEQYFNIPPSEGVDILTGSLSKAIPGNGGYIAGSEKILTFLRYSARPIIFSTSLSGPSVTASYQALTLLQAEGSDLCKSFHQKIRFLRDELKRIGVECEHSFSPISTVMIGNEEKAFSIAQQCYEKGLHILPVAFPAVARGTERLRITISVNHSFEMIKEGVEILSEVLENNCNNEAPIYVDQVMAVN